MGYVNLELSWRARDMPEVMVPGILRNVSVKLKALSTVEL